VRWFRYYSSTLSDIKVQSLVGNDFKGWINLLSLANESEPRGSLPDRSQIAFSLHLTKSQTDQLLTKLGRAGLVDVDQDSARISIHNWQKWQPESDNAASRMAQKRRTSTEQQLNMFRTSAEHVPPRLDPDQIRLDPDPDPEARANISRGAERAGTEDRFRKLTGG
jgi:hypothetical protein